MCAENTLVALAAHIQAAVVKISKQLSTRKSYKIISEIKSAFIKKPEVDDDDDAESDDDDNGDDDDDDDDDEDDDDETAATKSKRAAIVQTILDVRCSLFSRLL